jgi:hypothetical protein
MILLFNFYIIMNKHRNVYIFVLYFCLKRYGPAIISLFKYLIYNERSLLKKKIENDFYLFVLQIYSCKA